MSPLLKYLMLCLTVITVGAAQVAGAHASFFCEDTGKKTLQEHCGSSCHSDAESHGHQSPDSPSDPLHDPCLPMAPEHQHGEVVVELLATPAPASSFAPAVVWLAILTDPFPAVLKMAPGPAWPACRTQPPESPLLIESVRLPRTIVLLV